MTMTGFPMPQTLSAIRSRRQSSGNPDRERRDRHEFLVAFAPVAPHEDGETDLAVEHGQPVVPSVGLVGDTLASVGNESTDTNGVGATLPGMRRHDDQPAADIKRQEGL